MRFASNTKCVGNPEIYDEITYNIVEMKKKTCREWWQTNFEKLTSNTGMRLKK